MPPGPLISGVPTHASPALAPGDRGHELGRCSRAAVANTVRFYRRLLQRDLGAGDADLRRWGEQVADAVAAVDGGRLAVEIEGIAAGARQPVELLMVVNARTELLAGGRYAGGPGRPSTAECSVVGLPPDMTAAGRCHIAQNWDFHPDLRTSRLLWGIRNADGGWICSLVEAGMVGKLGLSSARLATALNFLATADDGGVDGVPIHVLARLALECPDAESAVRTLLGSRVAASSAITVAGRDRIAAVELTPSGSRALDPERGFVVHTNHFLDPPGIPDLGLGPRGQHGTLDRRRQLVRRFAGKAGLAPDDLFAALRSHANAPDSICVHKEGARWPWLERSVTLASLVVDVAAGILWLAGGNPCRRRHERLDVGRWLASHQP